MVHNDRITEKYHLEPPMKWWVFFVLIAVFGFATVITLLILDYAAHEIYR